MPKVAKKIIQSVLTRDVLETQVAKGVVDVKVSSNEITRVISILRDNSETLFDVLIDMFSIDYLMQRKQIDLVYILFSQKLNILIRVNTELYENQIVQSISGLFPSATWYEREIFDMMGVRFKNHLDLKKILTDDDFKGHPLRKDFNL